MPVMRGSVSFGFSTFKRTMNCWLKMSAEVMATLTSASFGTASFGVLQAARHSMRAQTTTPNERFIESLPWRAAASAGRCWLESLSLLQQTRGHVASHERDAGFAHIEAPRVLFRIDTDVRAGRHGSAGIDDRTFDDATGADAHVGENHRALDVTALLDVHVGEQQALIDVPAGDDAAAGDHRVHRHAAPAILVEHELRRRILAL